MPFSTQEARSIIRKEVKRVPEGEEVRHLNITAMMDMMSILLVAFIFQMSVTTSMPGDVKYAEAMTHEPLHETARVLTITPTAIVSEGQPIVAVRDGDVDASAKEGGALGMKIPALTNYLANLHRGDEEAAKVNGHEPPEPELIIVADRTTPYRLLTEVMFSAKQKESGYKRFRLVVSRAGASS